MQLLVTGGAGFIGSNFVRYWLEHHPEDSITNLDLLTYAGNLENLKGIDEKRYTFIQGDICDASVVKQAMEGAEVVIHFAAESHVDRSIEGSLPFLKTNVLGTQTLLDEAHRRGSQIRRFHHISTDEVFGALDLDTNETFNEKTPYDPRSPYSASKAASDHLVRAYQHTHQLPITISNCSNNYGPYHYPEKFIPLMIVQALHDKPLPLYGDGKNVRDWIHVEDHCAGIEAILLKGQVGETYCLGGNAERANIDVIKQILRELKKPESLIRFVSDRKGHDRRYAIDASKAKRELAWEPKKNFDEGLTETIQWFLHHEDWWKPLLP
ncbi:dTDP-glucose 4,6-dehydratase [Candidatus Uhrbacteria bacterium CG22_combo_CG10-13_8_21_14_all_47_17]|uniref:dTDP-glucose 4,6-dehydratase n=1 Tax=Candidatus Uhrbacteria bacterium CG22_combo_CG10-13_8_21_14_all_47_17 TaxID=1975041 RepID=A0A2H0BR65_9BACT|nr:MAG: dTDP-glucose 4,6-dehydratase [Candidatus Uhrbacteria bacterium CG22_combo_CG10-13_8_21_14_all_47_17]